MPSRPPLAHGPRSTTRRRVLASVVTALGVGVAGCSTAEVSPPDDGPNGSTTSATTDPTTTDSTTSSTTSSTPDSTTSADPTTTTLHAGYETTEIRVTTPDGDPLGSVTAAVADTPKLRYRGLSDTPSLPEDRGMLFVFEESGTWTFVMRGMEYGLDMVFADADGVVTTVHHAPAPGPDENGSQQRYRGQGRYVLELNYGWTTDRGVETGDVLHFEL